MNLPILYIVIPCYNEQEVLPITAPVFRDELMLLIEKDKVSNKSKILFVNDGSKDKTWEIICDFAKRDKHFCGISQSRNRGHQNALLAGLMEAKDNCDIAISIDCDGQDDVCAMEAMVDAYAQGCDIVYGVRSDRKTDSFPKRFFARSYYKLQRAMKIESIYDHADYRLTSSRVLKSLADFGEVNLYLRGMFPIIGFKSTTVPYARGKRLAGKTHYPLKKMLSLAIDGITGFTLAPIRLIFALGSLITFAGIIALVALAATSYSSAVGWIIAAMAAFSGITILCIGIVGEYIGKTYIETKKRPRYIIAERTEE